MYKLYAIRCPTYENVDGLLKGLKMTEKDEHISKLIALTERMMASLEDHQLRIGRLEQQLKIELRKEKKVSLYPGDREA